jgi:hypothetical protein
VIVAGAKIDTVAVPVTLPVPNTSLTLSILYVVLVAGVTLIVPLVVPGANVFTVPSFNVTLIGPLPLNLTFKVAVALSHIV